MTPIIAIKTLSLYSLCFLSMCVFTTRLSWQQEAVNVPGSVLHQMMTTVSALSLGSHHCDFHSFSVLCTYRSCKVKSISTPILLCYCRYGHFHMSVGF